MIFLQRKQAGKLFLTFLLICILSVFSVPPVDAEYSKMEQYNLGLERYDAGDYESAVYWFKQAAEKGDADSQCNLAWMYHNGKGVQQDYATAVYWYTKAAEQGQTSAQNNLALMYYKGEGVSQNPIYGYAWLDLAASHGVEQAIKYKGEIAASLSPQQLADAQQITADLQYKIYNISQTSSQPAPAEESSNYERANGQYQSGQDYYRQNYEKQNAYEQAERENFEKNLEVSKTEDGSLQFSNSNDYEKTNYSKWLEEYNKKKQAQLPQPTINPDWIQPDASPSVLDNFISRHPDRDPDAIREGYAQFQEELKAGNGKWVNKPIKVDVLEKLGRERIKAKGSGSFQSTNENTEESADSSLNSPMTDEEVVQQKIDENDRQNKDEKDGPDWILIAFAAVMIFVVIFLVTENMPKRKLKPQKQDLIIPQNEPASTETIKLESLQNAANRPTDPGPATPASTQLLKTGTKKCPFCAEEIKADAIKCRFCGEFLTSGEASIKNKYYPAPQNMPQPIIGTINESGKFLGGIHHPWRRFFARTFDYSTLGFIALIAVAFAIGYFLPNKARAFAEGLSNPLIASIILVVLWIPIEAILLSTTGNTPGKWLFGISVKTVSGLNLSFIQALERSFRVALQGLALGIPLVALFTQLFAYRRLTKTGTTLWDSAAECIVTHKTWGAARAIMCVIIMLVLFSVLSLLNMVFK